jgi:hypothetical protein
MWKVTGLLRVLFATPLAAVSLFAARRTSEKKRICKADYRASRVSLPVQFRLDRLERSLAGFVLLFILMNLLKVGLRQRFQLGL